MDLTILSLNGMILRIGLMMVQLEKWILEDMMLKEPEEV